MADEKMCIGVRDDEIMCSIDAEIDDTLLERTDCRPMIHGKRTTCHFVTGAGGLEEDLVMLSLVSLVN